MSELKNCPFCGGEVRFVKTGCSSRGKIGHLYCDGCKEIFFKNDRWHTESELYEKWNNRKPLERVMERLEEEERLADEEKERCSVKNPLQFDSAKGYSNGIYDAIQIIKEEMM